VIRHPYASAPVLDLPAGIHLLQRSDHLRVRMHAPRHKSAISNYEFILVSVRIFSGGQVTSTSDMLIKH